MKKEKKLVFENLLEERKKLSEEKINKKQTISSKDAELIDMLDNFNESDDYKEMQSDS